MANNVSGIFEQQVVPAATLAIQTARYNNPFLEYCYNGFDGSYGTIGQTLNINVPIVNEGDVNNIGSGAIQLTDTNHTPTTLTIDTNQSDAKRIQAFDQIRTVLDLERLYLSPMIESVLRKINRSVAALTAPAASTGFLSVNASQTGTLKDELSRADVATAWATLQGQGCPLRAEDTFCVTHHVPYAAAMADTTNNWIQQYVVGEAAATMVQRTARFMPQYEMQLNFDQTMPTVSGPHYYALAFHRYAIGLKPVLQPPVDTGGYVQETTIYPRDDVPFRLQFWYDPQQQGYVIHVNCVYGLKVVRPEWGVQIALKTS